VHLRVHVNDELTLDAGIFEEVLGETIVQPPKITLFRQVLDYLRSKPRTTSWTEWPSTFHPCGSAVPP